MTTRSSCWARVEIQISSWVFFAQHGWCPGTVDTEVVAGKSSPFIFKIFWTAGRNRKVKASSCYCQDFRWRVYLEVEVRVFLGESVKFLVRVFVLFPSTFIIPCWVTRLQIGVGCGRAKIQGAIIVALGGGCVWISRRIQNSIDSIQKDQFFRTLKECGGDISSRPDQPQGQIFYK